MNAMIVARKEIHQAIRNRWVLASTLLLAGLALSLTFLGSAPTGTVGVRALDVVIVSLSSLTIFLIPLIALLISHDAIVGDVERGTMLLLLSYPIARWQVLLGKFMGHLAVLTFATCLGYGIAAAALSVIGSRIGNDSLAAFAAMVGSSVMLGAAFVAIGYLVSALVRDRGTSAGACIGLWLLLVLIYDMALLGVLAIDQGRSISASAVDAMLLFNPTDVYRLFNLTGFASVSSFAGMAGLAQGTGLSAQMLLAVLLGWTVVPLGMAAFVFSWREL